MRNINSDNINSCSINSYIESGYSIVQICIPITFKNIMKSGENLISFTIGQMFTEITSSLNIEDAKEIDNYINKLSENPSFIRKACEYLKITPKNDREITYAFSEEIWIAKKNNITTLTNVKFITPFGTVNMGDIIDSYILCGDFKFDLRNVILI